MGFSCSLLYTLTLCWWSSSRLLVACVNGSYTMFQFLLWYVLVTVDSVWDLFCYPFSWIGLCIISRGKKKHIGKRNTIYLLKKEDRIQTQTFFHTHMLVCFFGFTLTVFSWYAASCLCILLKVAAAWFLQAIISWI